MRRTSSPSSSSDENAASASTSDLLLLPPGCCCLDGRAGVEGAAFCGAVQGEGWGADEGPCFGGSKVILEGPDPGEDPDVEEDAFSVGPLPHCADA